MSNWLQFSCCGLWPFGRLTPRYERLLSNNDEYSRIKSEIDIGLPPGVSIGDMFQNNQSTEILKQAYLLAVQSNNITDYLQRFDCVRIPESCKHTIANQISKLKSVQYIIWNTMISMAIGNVTIDDSALKALLDKQAGESIALIEMEKLVTALQMDVSKNWAHEIAQTVVQPPQSVITITNNPDLQTLTNPNQTTSKNSNKQIEILN
ncbi:ORF55 [Felid gammaherpesvirus 1]|uniref:ORF55 n=1 Tax=Felid gammaherpesvirus 1 TaxID=2560468 RepID=A0A0M5L4A8_9GAMA|nr:ORF55 [Felis catus gammaherpesvirus 1]ALE14769.1 ORF55 [Felis catus gammaherpesvirus 1]